MPSSKPAQHRSFPTLSVYRRAELKLSFVLDNLLVYRSYTSMAAAPGGKASSSMAVKSTPAQVLLLDLLRDGPDLELKFDDGSTLQGHASLLSLASGVLKAAIELGEGSTAAMGASNSKAASNACLITITLTGTSKEDWLEAMKFVYPVSPTPTVSFDNLELLMVIGSKYDMPSLLSRANTFLIQHTQQLVHAPKDSPLAIWKWLKLTDQACLEEACEACVAKLLELPASGMPVGAQELLRLSPITLRLLVAEMSKVVAEVGPNKTFCSRCKRFPTIKVQLLLLPVSPNTERVAYTKPKCEFCSADLA